MVEHREPTEQEYDAAEKWQEEPCPHPDGPAGRMTCIRCLVERINFHNPEVCVDVQEYCDRLKAENKELLAKLEWLDHVAADVKRMNEEVWEPMIEHGEMPRYTPETSLIVKQAREIETLRVLAELHEGWVTRAFQVPAVGCVIRLPPEVKRWIDDVEAERYYLKAKLERAGKRVENKARTIGIIRLYADGQANDAARELRAAIAREDGDDGA